MIPETTENKGFSKRALLPFVGDLSKSIFGIATENDVRVLAGHINALTRQQNKVARALARHGGDLSSYINQVDDRMDNLMEGIKENQVLTKILAAKITNETSRLQERFQKMTALYGEQIEKSQYVERYLGKLLSSIALLLTGKISPLLIPPKEMERTLNFVQRHLTPLGYQVLRQTPQYYYEFGKFSIMRRNLSIFISVKLPITPHNVRYNVFKILVFPVPVNESSPHATQLFDVNDYFVISSNHQFHTALSQSALNQCQGQKLMTCTLHPMLRTSAEITCEAALFLNDKEKIKKICNFRFLLNKIKPHILELPLSKILIYQISSFTLRCRGNDKIMKGCNYCMMTIPCQCTVIGNNMQFDQKIILCKNETRDIMTLYPVNLAVIQQFFNDSQLRKVLADTSFNNPIDIKIPSFRIYEHKMANIFADDNLLKF